MTDRETPAAPSKSAQNLRALLVASLILFTPLVARAQAAPYRISPSGGSRLALEVFKTGLMSGKKHLFVFARYGGTLHYDPKAPEQSSVRLLIESQSAQLKDDWVKPADFKKIEKYAFEEMLAASRYPEITFVSRRIESSGEKGFRVEGDLIIRDITKPAIIHVGIKEKPAGGLLFEGRSTIKLQDYGLKPPSAALGLIGTKNEMEVTFRLRAQ